jgi:enamine deaminase RidA (YjgF/YER057c/UK114 family)
LVLFTTIAAFAAAAQSGGARQQAVVIMPENARQRQLQEQIGWADAVVSNGVVYVSGVPAYLAPGEKDMENAFVRAFDAIGKTLQRAGVSWDDVVELRTYHTDPTAQIDAFAKVKSRYMKSPPPAWSAIGTSGLDSRQCTVDPHKSAKRRGCKCQNQQSAN